MSQHDPHVRMRHMCAYASEAVDLLGERSNKDVADDRVLQLALVRLVEVVGEAASRVPAEARARYPDVPWREASSTRNLLIHGYDIVRVDILCDTIRNDFPPLIEALRRILDERDSGSSESRTD